jgi:hypothetical protein
MKWRRPALLNVVMIMIMHIKKKKMHIYIFKAHVDDRDTMCIYTHANIRVRMHINEKVSTQNLDFVFNMCA